MHFHMMAICGIGVSGLARLLHARGHQVSGCDAHVTGPAEELRALGIEVLEGHSPSHVHRGVDALVISTAIPDDHPEVLEAKARGLKVSRRIEVLGELLRERVSVGVAGTHGKTTTSSMIAAALLGAGLDPAALIGGIVPELNDSNARVGQGPLVAEVDESDPLFAHLAPSIAVITNAEDDHVALPGETRQNYHASLEALMDAFRAYARGAGSVVYCADWPGLEALTAGARERVSYGTCETADYRAVNIEHGALGVAFDALRGQQVLGRVLLSIPGEHNVLNALAAVAVADRLGADFARVAEALSRFKGAGRRWQHIGSLGGALVIDDYAHHPTEVAATLSAARRSGRRVRVVFQPHRYLRTAQVWPRFAEELRLADEVILLDVYGAGEAPIAGVHSERIRERMHELGFEAVSYAPTQQDAITRLLSSLGDTDLIITMGAGDVWKVGPALLQESA
ncbi:UDP-N-acetylmuramate--alanine ligase [Deinobacterium chartae]|uniref:UDP-N-acetylmuramate--L-alanine ligase n=1 Tax=Deinobacterium chartae TaxID=521158 RepID=A0A841I1R4_9DEIO|nr:UDP-N-acetylmuramate--L-alanine ligase [Deinobacterium chartae]MBB6098002.1 UDP-N-acetylmuramate--alanine ligase [Deinobacterium chartae]